MLRMVYPVEEKKKEEYYKGKEVRGTLEKKKEYYKGKEVKGEKKSLQTNRRGASRHYHIRKRGREENDVYGDAPSDGRLIFASRLRADRKD